MALFKTKFAEIASQAEAEGGSVNDKFMTPLRTKQEIDKFAGGIDLIKLGILNSWTQIASMPNTSGVGIASAYAGGDYIYVLRGNNTYDFWRYSISDNSWTTLASAPNFVAQGSALVYGGGDYLYAFRGNNTATFWRYSISQNQWSALANVLSNRYSNGQDLVYTGGDYLYALQGNNTTIFYRYSISGNTWMYLSDILYASAYGALGYPAGGDNIYGIPAGGSSAICTYSISNNMWEFALGIPILSKPNLVFTGLENFIVFDPYFSIGRYTFTVPSYARNIDKPTAFTSYMSAVYPGGKYIYVFNAGDNNVWRGEGKVVV